MQDASSSYDDYMKSPEFLAIAYRDFVDTHASSPVDIKKAAASADLKMARFIAHALKGAAGLMGEDKLYNLSAEAEHGFKRGIVDDGVLDKLICETQRVLEECRRRVDIF